MRDLELYTIQCMEELEALHIEYGNIIDVKVNTRAKKRWGQCRTVPDGYEININAVLLDERNSERGLKETIIHELLHSCSGCMNHGKIWKQLAEKVNRAYGYGIKRCSSDEENGVLKETKPVEPSAPKRTVVCVNCGYICTGPGLKGIIRKIKQYRCACCGSKLKIVDPACAK